MEVAIRCARANGLLDRPGRRQRGRNRSNLARILAMSRQHPAAGNRWTVRTAARAAGVSHATVQHVWREHAIGHDGSTVLHLAAQVDIARGGAHSK